MMDNNKMNNNSTNKIFKADNNKKWKNKTIKKIKITKTNNKETKTNNKWKDNSNKTNKMNRILICKAKINKVNKIRHNKTSNKIWKRRIYLNSKKTNNQLTSVSSVSKYSRLFKFS